MLGRYCNGTGATEGLGESSEYHEVGVKPDTLQATDAKREKAVVMFQASELALHGSAAPVQVAEPLRVSAELVFESRGRHSLKGLQREHDLFAAASSTG